jgi:putative SOS response-associated peptidase YedK
MCSHYQALQDRAKFEKEFRVKLPPYEGANDIWPTYAALFVRRPPEADVGDEAVPEREALPGQFGLIPAWAKDEKFGRRTFNARSETAATLPSFRDAWRKAQRCIIPAEAIYEPDWRSGKARPTRITRSDGAALGVAGLWSRWKSPAGTWVASFTMLTLNADAHPLMRHFHKPGDEKRMVAILPEARYDDWLTAAVGHAMEFMQPYPADQLHASTDGDEAAAERQRQL